MIQDIAPHILSNHYENRTSEPGDPVIYVRGKEVFCGISGGRILLPERIERTAPDCVYAFSLDGQSIFLCWKQVPEEGEGGIGIVWHNISDLRAASPAELRMAVITAWHLAVWYQDTVFCGRCGTRLVPDSTERMMRCPSCGRMIYPTIMPAVIVAVTDGDRILLTRYSGRSYRRFALVAGYTEIGETSEQTAAREVMEETGVRIRNLHYYKSQPWGFSETLLTGFFCELDGPDRLTVDHSELSEAVWLDRAQLAEQWDSRDGVSLTSEMIGLFLVGKDPISTAKTAAKQC